MASASTSSITGAGLARSGGAQDGPQAPIRLAPINGLRGIAILAVIFFHVVCGVWPANAVPIWLSPLLTNGWTGVNLFFILSGFVLFLPHAAGKRTLQTIGGRLSFYRRRFLRLMPLFYIAAITEWLFATSHGGNGVAELFSVMSLAFILNPHTFGPSFNVSLWSIGDEIAFSALFPFLVEAARRRGIGWVLGVVILAALGARLGGISTYPALQGSTFNSDMFLCRLDEFVIGMMLAQLYIERRLPRYPERWAFVGVMLVALAWTGFDMVLRGTLLPISRAGLNDVLDAGLFMLGSAALVPATRLYATLSWRPLQLLGMMCYSLYIWHLPLLNWLMSDRAMMSSVAYAWRLAIFFVLTLTLSVISYRFIEFGRTKRWRPLFLLGSPSEEPPPPPGHRMAAVQKAAE